MDGHPLANKLKLDFNINVDLSDVVFVKSNIRKYNENTTNNVFGEKLCLLYAIEFSIYNVPFSLKILAFAYVSRLFEYYAVCFTLFVLGTFKRNFKIRY